MNEEPKSIWKKSWTGSGSIIILSLLIVSGVFLVALIYALANWEKPVADTFVIGAMVGTIIVACCLFILYIVLPLSRWLFWKHWRRTLFGFACLVALILLGYAEENWRGKHEWEKFKHEWEAKGEHFNFASIVPPTVPDEQNFALTPVAASCYANLLTSDGRRITSGSPLHGTNTIHWLMTPDGTKISSEIPFTNVVNRLDFDLGDDYGYRTNGMGNWAKGTMTDLKLRLELFATKTNLFVIPPPSSSPAQDVLQVLGKFDTTVEELRTAALLPETRFPLNYDNENPAAILLPHLAALKRSSQVLQLRAIAELQNGESEKALADIKLSLRLADTIRAEPFLISHLVRIAILQITLQPIYEGLAEHKWSAAQLIGLDTELTKMDYLASYKLSMRGEMVFQGGIFDYLRHHPEQLMNMSGNFEETQLPLPVRIVWGLMPTGWFYQNQLRCARPMVEFYLPAADLKQATISPAKIRAADSFIDADTKRTTPYNVIERMLLPALGNAVKKFAYAQATVDLARTAIALERYRLAHGEFPESLDALAPQFIAQVPHDVIGGEPLKYRRVADQPSQSSGSASGQFVLYSVGWNEKDDGGAVVYTKGNTPGVDTAQGDWVWRYPQKE